MSIAVGKKIVAIEPLSKETMEELGWYETGTSVVLILEDGTKLFPSCDPEGNAPGALFFEGADGKEGILIVQEA